MNSLETKKCKYCKTDVPAKASKCPHCQSDLRNWFERHPIITILLALFFLGTFSQSMLGTQQIAQNQTSQSNPNSQEEKKENWNYFDSKDEMTDKTIRFALNTSINTIDLKFPYQGGSKGTLTLRNKGGEKDVIFAVQPSQINSTYGDEHVMVRFDDKPAMKFSYNEPADHSRDKVFIINTSKFLDNIKNAKKVKIEVGFYDNGGGVLEFNTNGFDYEKFIK